LSITAVIIAFASSIFWTILPPYMWDLGFGFLDIAIVYVSQSVVMILFSRLLGIFADSLGRKKFIVGELVVLLIAYIFLYLCVYSDSLNVLTISTFSALMGLAWAIGSGAFAAAITTSLSRERTGFATGLYVTADTLGWTIGSFVSGAFVDVFGMGLTLIVSIFVIVLGFLTIGFYHEKTIRKPISLRSALKDSWALSLPSKDNLLVYLFIIVAVLNIGAAIFFLVFVIKFYMIVGSKTMYGLLSGISGLLSMLVPYFVGKLSESVDKEKILFWALIVRVLFMAVMVFSWDLWIAILFWITPLWPIVMLELISLTTDYSIENRESEAHAVRNLIGMVLQTIGNIIGGLISELINVEANLELMAIILGIGVAFYALGIPLSLILYRKSKISS